MMKPPPPPLLHSSSSWSSGWLEKGAKSKRGDVFCCLPHIHISMSSKYFSQPLYLRYNIWMHTIANLTRHTSPCRSGGVTNDKRVYQFTYRAFLAWGTVVGGFVGCWQSKENIDSFWWAHLPNLRTMHTVYLPFRLCRRGAAERFHKLNYVIPRTAPCWEVQQSQLPYKVMKINFSLIYYLIIIILRKDPNWFWEIWDINWI